MKIGYIRVSTQDQHEELQRDALTKAECEKFFLDKGSGAKFDRKGLQELITFARSGDVVVVWKLDRLGRSLIDLIKILNTLNTQGVEFISLTENIDTTSPSGKLIFYIMAALAEYERALMLERTHAGLAAARARGKKGGRPRKVKSGGKIALARRLWDEKQTPVMEICEMLGISKTTFYSYIKEEKDV